jgi:hypothetical protein
MGSQELASNPRPARQSQQISTFQYRSLSTINRSAGTAGALGKGIGKYEGKTAIRTGGHTMLKNRLPMATKQIQRRPAPNFPLKFEAPSSKVVATSVKSVAVPIPTKILSIQSLRTAGAMPAKRMERKGGRHPDQCVDILLDPHKFDSARLEAKESLTSLFEPAHLQALFPNTRIIFNARYPWYIPMKIRQPLSESHQQIFIDLPARPMRYYYLKSRLKSLILDNTYALLKEVVALLNEVVVLLNARNVATTVEKRRTINQYLDTWFPFGVWRPLEERKAAVAKVQTDDISRERNILVPNKSTLTDYYKEFVYRLLALSDRAPAHIILQNLNGSYTLNVASAVALSNFLESSEAQRIHGEMVQSWKDVVEHTSYRELLEQLVDRTGMALQGECQLIAYLGKERFQTYQSVTEREHESRGHTLFGFTLEELQRMFTLLKETSQLRMIQDGLNQLGAYVVDASDRYSSVACREAPVHRSYTLQDEANAKYRQLSDDKKLCKRSLNTDLRDATTDLPVFPIWNRYGSHLILRADVEDTFEKKRELMNQELINKDEYAQLINFMVTGNPRSDQSERGLKEQRCMIERAPSAPYSTLSSIEIAPTVTDVVVQPDLEVVTDVIVTKQKGKGKSKTNKKRGGDTRTEKSGHGQQESSYIVRQLEERSKGSKSKAKAKVTLKTGGSSKGRKSNRFL